MSIEVTVVPRSVLKKILQVESVTIILEGPATIQTLAARLVLEYGEPVQGALYDSQGRFAWLCVKNKQKVLPDEPVSDGDVVMLLPPLAGG